MVISREVGLSDCAPQLVRVLLVWLLLRHFIISFGLCNFSVVFLLHKIIGVITQVINLVSVFPQIWLLSYSIWVLLQICGTIFLTRGVS